MHLQKAVEAKRPGAGRHPKVFLLDADHQTIHSLTELFLDMGLDVMACGDAGELMESIESHEPGIVVLNSLLPEGPGLDVQKQLLASDVEMPIIFLSQEHDVHTCVQAMKAGAIDFLLKPIDKYALLRALDAALVKEESGRRIAEIRRKVLNCARTLTRREREVFDGVTRGLMNKQIAYDLGISEIMVKIHRGNMMRKMQARSLADLVRMSELVAAANSRKQVTEERLFARESKRAGCTR
ncbi:LuxR C-terminal-related transcriptional regulator [Sinorhizobium garamanticum]|uniref:LuxR C-terminal-related transcriptional regulator n=1 Tax=Sinorhizobium garamanticum TaxID=680247 RepID=A0ABY8DKY1_9HYPH|nr:LuxR C-terminal-related transcriptional regulator [Sinorhizobium garamanticum]WEX90892.1 LuxR C-terminal-related transcriptional regulator [Sinorhizobium garamanticum]